MPTVRTAAYSLVAVVSFLMAGVQAIAGNTSALESSAVCMANQWVGAVEQPGVDESAVSDATPTRP